MNTWTNNELERLGAAEELEIAPGSDGVAGHPVVVWIVRDGDDLYVRSVNGRDSSWFRRALTRHEAVVRASGIEKNVRLVESNDADNQVDDAYRAKYGPRYPSIVPSILAPEAQAATLRLEPS